MSIEPAEPAPERVLSIEDILAADDLPTGMVKCPEWGGSVQVRALSRKQVIDLIDQCKDDDEGLDSSKFQMRLAIAGMGVTEDRAVQLNKKHPTPIKRICDEVRRLSGLDGGAVFLDAED